MGARHGLRTLWRLPEGHRRGRRGGYGDGRARHEAARPILTTMTVLTRHEAARPILTTMTVLTRHEAARPILTMTVLTRHEAARPILTMTVLTGAGGA